MSEFVLEGMTGPKAPTIAGLGMTALGKVYGKTPAQFAADAVRLAADDAGIGIFDIDGMIVSSGIIDGVHLSLQHELAMTDLKFLTEMQAMGATAAEMIQVASMAVLTGMAETIVCVWADAPLRQGLSQLESFSGPGRHHPTGWASITSASGLNSANQMYALAARRHMEKFGTKSEQLGAISVAQREWASLNPLAQYRDPITIDDYMASRWVAEPFRLFDCCVVSNGGIAIIVTTRENAKNLRQPPVNVLGWAQAHPGHAGFRDENFGIVSGAATSGPQALAMANVTLEDIDVVELYDCYTFTALITLEDYGFCAKGEGGDFVSSGVLGPKGSLKLNTGGGQLSSYYMWGMTPLSEAIIQARGQAGERQVDKHELVLVSGNGGILDHHSTLVLAGNN